MEVILIGTGNLGSHLCRAIEAINGGDHSAFAKAESKQPSSQIFLKAYYNHTAYDLDGIKAPRITDLHSIPECDLIIIATPDDHIASISNKLNADAVVVHTSGSVPLEALSAHKHHGVLYFPQSFSKARPVDFSTIPVCVEYATDAAQKCIEVMASSLSRKRYHLNSQQRKQLHIAAVFTNNFVNHCYTIAQQLLDEQDLDAALLEPLMKETLQKAIDLSPYDAQTGPARRGDQETINTHLQLLDAAQKEVYQSITQSILNTYGN